MGQGVNSAGKGSQGKFHKLNFTNSKPVEPRSSNSPIRLKMPVAKKQRMGLKKHKKTVTERKSKPVPIDDQYGNSDTPIGLSETEFKLWHEISRNNGREKERPLPLRSGTRKKKYRPGFPY